MFVHLTLLEHLARKRHDTEGYPVLRPVSAPRAVPQRPVWSSGRMLIRTPDLQPQFTARQKALRNSWLSTRAA